MYRLEQICWNHLHPSDFVDPQDEDPASETGHALLASSFCVATAPASLYPDNEEHQSIPEGPIPSWHATGLTLQNLRMLASSLSQWDVEITPVQAWFELVERYGRDALSVLVMDELKREFMGVVKCPHFGAVIEREAFDSVVGRVLEKRVHSPLEGTI